MHSKGLSLTWKKSDHHQVPGHQSTSASNTLCFKLFVIRLSFPYRPHLHHPLFPSILLLCPQALNNQSLWGCRFPANFATARQGQNQLQLRVDESLRKSKTMRRRRGIDRRLPRTNKRRPLVPSHRKKPKLFARKLKTVPTRTTLHRVVLRKRFHVLDPKDRHWHQHPKLNHLKQRRLPSMARALGTTWMSTTSTPRRKTCPS